MEYRTLGSSGTSVSNLALGTMTFGSETDRDGASHAQLDVFLAAGGTLVDTADVYSAGRSEEIIGALARRPPRRRHRPGGAGHQGPLPDAPRTQRPRARPAAT